MKTSKNTDDQNLTASSVQDSADVNTTEVETENRHLKHKKKAKKPKKFRLLIRFLRWGLNPDIESYKRPLVNGWQRIKYFGHTTRSLYDNAWLDPNDLEIAKTVRDLEQSARFHLLRAFAWLGVAVIPTMLILGDKTLLATTMLGITALMLAFRGAVDVFVSMKAHQQLDEIRTQNGNQ